MKAKIKVQRLGIGTTTSHGVVVVFLIFLGFVFVCFLISSAFVGNDDADISYNSEEKYKKIKHDGSTIENELPPVKQSNNDKRDSCQVNVDLLLAEYASLTTTTTTTKMGASCEEEAREGRNVLLKRLLEFAKKYDEKHKNTSRKRFFCDLMIRGPYSFENWKEDFLFSKDQTFTWNQTMHHHEEGVSIIRFFRGKTFCGMFADLHNFLARENKKKVIIIGPFGDGENWGLFSGGFGSPYFRNRPVESVFENLLCPNQKWSKVLQFLNDDRLLFWVGFQNNLLHHKVISIPLGLEKRFTSSALSHLRDALLSKKTKLVGLTFGNGSNSRTEWFQKAKQTIASDNLIISTINPWNLTNRKLPENERRLVFDDSLMVYRVSKIILAPGGLGVDTKRPFESILNGAVPLLLKNNGLYNGLKDLPVLFASDDYELNEETIQNEYVKLVCRTDPPFRFEKMTFSGWVDFILEEKQKHLKR